VLTRSTGDQTPGPRSSSVQSPGVASQKVTRIAVTLRGCIGRKGPKRAGNVPGWGLLEGRRELEGHYLDFHVAFWKCYPMEDVKT
jgi:hypothetical protein